MTVLSLLHRRSFRCLGLNRIALLIILSSCISPCSAQTKCLSDEAARKLALDVVRHDWSVAPELVDLRRYELFELELASMKHDLTCNGSPNVFVYEVHWGQYRITKNDVRRTGEPDRIKGFIAVARRSKHHFSMYDSTNGAKSFNELVTELKLRLDATSVRRFASMFMRMAMEQSVVTSTLKLRLLAQEHFLGYMNSSASEEQRLRMFQDWWDGAKNRLPLQLTSDVVSTDEGYRTQFFTLKLTIGRAPVVEKWTVGITENGSCLIKDVAEVYPPSMQEEMRGQEDD